MVYLAVVASGAYLLWILTALAGVQYWAYGKILLLVVAIVLTIKARKNPNNATFGIALVWVSLAGILALAFIKPTLFG